MEIINEGEENYISIPKQGLVLIFFSYYILLLIVVKDFFLEFIIFSFVQMKVQTLTLLNIYIYMLSLA